MTAPESRDRAQLAAALEVAYRKAAAEPHLSWGPGYDDRWWVLRRHTWWVTRTADGTRAEGVEGRTLTRAGMERARHRAYLRLLNPRPAVETSRLANRWRTWVN